MDLRDLSDHLFKRPAMWVNPATLETVCAFLSGYDVARDGGPLCGFREWLVVMADAGDSLHWTGLIAVLLRAQQPVVSDVSHDPRIEALGRLIREYLEHCRKHGITRVFCDYDGWLRRQTWYEAPRSE